jgi:hypothetical protein
MAAITPPLGPDGFLDAPDRTESTDEVTPPLADAVMLPETELWRTGLVVSGVVVGVGIGDDGNDDNDGTVSDEPMGAERVGLGFEEDGIIIVTVDVETPTIVVGVGVSPMFDAGISVTIVVVTGMPVVRSS